MNLHKIAQVQTRYVTAPVIDVNQWDICEWYTYEPEDPCDNLMTQALIDTEDGTTTFHGPTGSCITHVCDDHIQPALARTLSPI